MFVQLSLRCHAALAVGVVAGALSRPPLEPCHLSGTATAPQQINCQQRILCTTQIGRKFHQAARQDT